MAKEEIKKVTKGRMTMFRKREEFKIRDITKTFISGKLIGNTSQKERDTKGPRRKTKTNERGKSRNWNKGR